MEISVRRIAAWIALAFATTSVAAQAPRGDAVIRAPALGSEIVIRTTSRLAGAIDSLTWNGREFIDSFDHGRQLQSACSFDCGKGGPFWAECFNPTEAGSRRDGAGPTSSSRLLELQAEGNELRTVVQPAFWLAPGEESSGRPAMNDRILSAHRIAKRVRIGHGDLPNVIEYGVTFTVPPGEHHTFAQFEAVTGYMPAEFEKFYRFVPDDGGALQPLDDGPGEQAYPVVLATADGKHAMGVYSPVQPSPGFEQAGYGRFRFAAERVTKWNCVFRVRRPEGIPAGDYEYRAMVVVGTLDDMKTTFYALTKEAG
jgi:hypothetical protein